VVLAELFGALLERRRRQGRAPSTVADYEDMSRRLGRELGHDTPVAEIDAQRLERMVAEFTAERRISDASAAQRRSQGATVIRRDGQWIEVSPAAPRTIQKYLVWLHAAFKLALKKDWVAVNPVADMDEDLRPRFKRRELTRDEFYSPAEVARLLAACEEGRQRALLGLACYAGLRLGEIRGLRVGGVDFASERLHISDNIVRSRLKKPKSGVGRNVPLAAELAALLRPLTTGRRPGEFVLLTNSGTPVYESLAGEWFHFARKAAGLKRLQLRMCRHSFGTACAAAGVDVRTLQNWMGHASVTTTEIYMAYAPKPEEAAMVSRAFRLDSGPVDLAA
jgi:integrase